MAWCGLYGLLFRSFHTLLGMGGWGGGGTGVVYGGWGKGYVGGWVEGRRLADDKSRLFLFFRTNSYIPDYRNNLQK